MLGLGLGLNKGGYVKPLPKWLTDAGCTFAINVDRQVKALANPNSPLVNPLIDVVGKLGKNLFDQVVATKSRYINFSNGLLAVSADWVSSDFIQSKPLTDYYLNIGGSSLVVANIACYDSAKNYLGGIQAPSSLGFSGKTLANTAFIRVCYRLVGEATNTFQLELGTVPTTYEPYGFNNVLLQSVAGTTADGYTQIALPNGKNPWFLNQDGTDSYMIGVNAADTDIIGTINFGLGFYIRTNGTLVNSWLISKAESSEATTQYGVKITSAGALQIFLNGTAITLATGLAINTPYKIVIVREAGVLKCEVNDVQTYSAANVISLTTRPNLRLGARSSNAGGTTHTEFYNGYYGAFDLSQGSLCTLASFKKSFAKLIGGTYES